jgi:hypothetical protein
LITDKIIMEIEFIIDSIGKLKPKATIHMTGKLGLNQEASDLIGKIDAKSFLIGKDVNDSMKLYLLDSEAVGSVKVSKAGNYYYLNAANVFDKLNIDYKNKIYVYDISKDTYDKKEIFVLSQRDLKERTKKTMID